MKGFFLTSQIWRPPLRLRHFQDSLCVRWAHFGQKCWKIPCLSFCFFASYLWKKGAPCPQCIFCFASTINVGKLHKCTFDANFVALLLLSSRHRSCDRRWGPHSANFVAVLVGNLSQIGCHIISTKPSEIPCLSIVRNKTFYPPHGLQSLILVDQPFSISL